MDTTCVKGHKGTQLKTEVTSVCSVQIGHKPGVRVTSGGVETLDRVPLLVHHDTTLMEQSWPPLYPKLTAVVADNSAAPLEQSSRLISQKSIVSMVPLCQAQ